MPNVNYESLDYEFGTYVGSMGLLGYVFNNSSPLGKSAGYFEETDGKLKLNLQLQA